MDDERCPHSSSGDDNITLHGEGDAEFDLYRRGRNGRLSQATCGLNSALGNGFNGLPSLFQRVNGMLAYPSSSPRGFRAGHLDGRDQHNFITETQFG